MEGKPHPNPLQQVVEGQHTALKNKHFFDDLVGIKVGGAVDWNDYVAFETLSNQIG